MTNIIPVEVIENKIFVIHGHRVMIDRDLAELYGVQTKVLNQTVKRNIKRFPPEFMFQLNNNEKNELVTICDRFKKLTHSTSNPYVFTEHGVSMLSSVLNSEQAIAINIQIIKAFVKLREFALTHKEMAQRLDELERTVITMSKDTRADINEIFRQLRNLAEITKPSQTDKIGFKAD
jgi:phage regulator Rha-like protein